MIIKAAGVENRLEGTRVEAGTLSGQLLQWSRENGPRRMVRVAWTRMIMVEVERSGQNEEELIASASGSHMK